MSGLRRLAAAAVAAGALVCVPAPEGASAATPCSKTYRAVKNDSWAGIAAKAGVPMSTLLKKNKATTRTMILIGDVLCLPNAAKAKESGTVVKVPAKKYTAAQSAAIIRRVFPKRLEARAIAIAKRESKLNAHSYSYCCYGLFQIYFEAHRDWMKAFGVTSASQLLDPLTNAKMALQVYRRSGSWAPWAIR